MKINRISDDLAKEILTNSEENKGFSIIKINGCDYTIYHRTYQNTYYDILEMNTNVEELDKTVTTFYVLDPIEVEQLLKNENNTMRKISVGDSVYLLVSPTNTKLLYRYEKCTVTNIIKYKTPYITEQILSVDASSIEDPNDFKFCLDYESYPSKYHTSKQIDKIYLLDELDVLQKDIDKLNKLQNFKTKQKEELQKFVDELRADWDYKGTLSLR